MAKPKKKARRVILGVGHPWFFAREGVQYDAVTLFEGHGQAGSPVYLKFRNVGNWNKVRLVLEILK
jgi:hypothetical protein